MTVRLISFTDRGQELGARLAEALGGVLSRCGQPMALQTWTARAFAEAEALVFIGAAGIAVRAVAPYVRSKASDPAVVVVDETGRFAIPILSGHLGGANALAREIAGILGGTPVITTATDCSGVFAVDLWAKRQGCAVAEPERIKAVSARLLSGGSVTVKSDFPISGSAPQGIVPAASAASDVHVTLTPGDGPALHLIPRIAVLGVGCKRGVSRCALEQALFRLLDLAGISPLALSAVSSIDRKAQEPGLLAFCETHGLPLRTFLPEELQRVEGVFSGSDFVKRVTGVDNVCERSAVLCSGGRLLVRKQAAEGITMALALRPFAPDWRWQDV